MSSLISFNSSIVLNLWLISSIVLSFSFIFSLNLDNAVIRNIKTNKCFAIECKYRSNFKYSKYFKEKGLTVRKEHLDSYKEFRKNTNYPVYVIFGFRGYADNPDSMFLIPLDKVEMFMNEKYLKNYSFALDKDFIDLNNILK